MLGMWIWLAFGVFVAVGTIAVFVKLAMDIVWAALNPRAGWAAFVRWCVGDLARRRNEPSRRQAGPDAAPDRSKAGDRCA